jgi:ParB family chromosome partitioning protein
MQFSKAKIRHIETNVNNQTNKTRSSIYTENFKGEFYNISVDKLIPFKNQARKIFDEKSILNLAETIKEHGIRQPLTVIPSDIREGCYEVISGERRLRAAKSIGMEKVPCIIIHDMLKAEEIALIENIQREDLHPVELFKAFSNLLHNNICANQSEIAKKVGLPRTSVVEIMSLSALSSAVQELLIDHNIKSREFLRKLLKANESDREKMIDDYVKLTDARKNRASKIRKKVISIELCGDHFEIKNNIFSKLSPEKQAELREIISKLVS